MRILLLLPCNKYAKEGNYFLGTYWRIADKWRKKLGINVTLGAVDCIPLFCKGENNAIVLETEMNKVIGCDVYPRYDPEKVDIIARGIYTGLMKIHNKFDKIIILLNIKLYIEATKKALSELPPYIKNKINFHYIHGYPGKFQKKIILKLKQIKQLETKN